MPPKFDFAHTTQLDTIELLTSRPSRIDFDAGDGLHLVVEAHAPGVFRLRFGEASLLNDDKPGARARRREMLLARQEAVGESTISPRDDGDGWRIAQGDVTLEVRSIRCAWRCTAARPRSSSPRCPRIRPHSATTRWMTPRRPPGPPVSRWAPTSASTAWAKPGDLNRREESVVSDDPEHRALPLAWSPQGWGVYVNTMRRVEHAVGAAPAESAYVLTVDDAVLDLFLFAGEPGEILNQYTALTGRAGQPVLWAMGAWLQQASGEMPTQTVALLARMRENQIPVDAVTLAQPAAWGFLSDKTVFEWDAQRFPDAKQMLALFHKHNVHVAASAFRACSRAARCSRNWKTGAGCCRRTTARRRCSTVFPRRPASLTACWT